MIEESFMLTIFGYSAPSSDKKAVSLLKRAWGPLEKRQLEQTCFIDIIDESEIRKRWEEFIYTHHYQYTNDFFQSYLGMFPRRTCETVFATYMLNVPPRNDMGFHKDMTWNEIEELISELVHEEETTEEGKNYPLHYTNRGLFS